MDVDTRELYDPWWKRVGWLLLLWLLGVGALAVVAFALKVLMRFAGFTN